MAELAENVADPSSATETPTTDANTTTPAASSTADTQDANATADKPKSLLDAIKSVVAEPKEATATTAAPPSESKDVTEEDDTRPPPFHEHPRWQKMLKDNADLLAPADQYRKIEAFARHNNLEPKDIVDGFKVMALLKNDRPKALEYFRGLVGNLEAFLGEKLPLDLQEKVDGGLIDEATAKETAKLRAATAATVSQTAEAKKRDEAAETTRRETEARTAIVGAVTTWETAIKVRDPDYAKKQKFVMDRVVALSRVNGAPATPADATKLAQRAYDEVTKDMAGVAPARPATRRIPTSVSATVVARPKSMLEAVNGAVGR